MANHGHGLVDNVSTRELPHGKTQENWVCRQARFLQSFISPRLRHRRCRRRGCGNCRCSASPAVPTIAAASAPASTSATRSAPCGCDQPLKVPQRLRRARWRRRAHKTISHRRIRGSDQSPCRRQPERRTTGPGRHEGTVVIEVAVVDCGHLRPQVPEVVQVGSQVHMLLCPSCRFRLVASPFSSFLRRGAHHGPRAPNPSRRRPLLNSVRNFSTCCLARH